MRARGNAPAIAANDERAALELLPRHNVKDGLDEVVQVQPRREDARLLAQPRGAGLLALDGRRREQRHRKDVGSHAARVFSPYLAVWRRAQRHNPLFAQINDDAGVDASVRAGT